MDGDYDAIKSEDVYVVADVLRQFFKELKPSLIPVTDFQINFANTAGETNAAGA